MRTAILFLLAAGAAMAQDEEIGTRMFDVRFLTAPGTEVGEEVLVPPVDWSEPMAVPVLTDPNMERFVLSPEGVWPLLRHALPSIGWDNPGVSEEYSSGVLTVRAPASSLDRMGAAFDFLNRTLGRRVTIDVEVVRFQPGVLESLGAGAGTLGADVEGKVREAEADGKRSSVIAVLRAVTTDGRCATASSTHDRTFVMGYSAMLAAKSAIMEPHVRRHRVGAVMEIRPVLAGDGEPAVLDIRLAVAQPGPESEFEGGAPGEGRVQQPTRSMWAWEAATRVQPGRTSILFAGSADGIAGDGEVAVLVRVSVGEAGGDFPSGPEDRSLRVIDAGPALARFVNRPGEELGLPPEEHSGGGGAVTIPDDEAESGMDDEELGRRLLEPLADDEKVVHELVVAGGKAWMRGTPAQLEVVSQRMREISSNRRALAVDAVVAVIPETEWLKRKAGIREASAAADCVSRAVRGEGSRVAARVRACGISGQVFHAAAYDERPFVVSRNVEIADEKSAGIPVVGFLRQGFSWTARVRTGADPARASVLFEGEQVWGGVITAIEESSPAGRAQSASPRTFESSSSTTVALGAWTVAGVDLGEAPGGGREARVLFFRVTEAR
ncbi:MAG: hypothetical protein K8T20_13640 [Planctomycetes bacterium]|nr:hypothetical protein [Planctomycetota bacterium]